MSQNSQERTARTVCDTVAIGAVRRMAALLDHCPQEFGAGSVVPGHWHPFLCTPSDLTEELGDDGHPAQKSAVVPPEYSRRMFAGRRVAFEGALRVGMAVTRRSAVKAVTLKNGRSGPMYFVTMEHELQADGGGFVAREEHDIVYRTAPGQGQPAAHPATSRPTIELPLPDITRQWRPCTIELFRYSALTFNSHRIHYDADYVRDIEGYPGLVVNGGLTTLMLCELVRGSTGQDIVESESRNTSPLFVDRPVSLHAALQDGHRAVAWATDGSGKLSTHMRLRLGETP